MCLVVYFTYSGCLHKTEAIFRNCDISSCARIVHEDIEYKDSIGVEIFPVCASCFLSSNYGIECTDHRWRDARIWHSTASNIVGVADRIWERAASQAPRSLDLNTYTMIKCTPTDTDILKVGYVLRYLWMDWWDRRPGYNWEHGRSPLTSRQQTVFLQLRAIVERRITDLTIARYWSSQFTRRTCRQLQIVDLSEDDRTCSICTDEYDCSNPPVSIPCDAGHVFHSACITRWAAEYTYGPHKVQCPMCRRPLNLYT